MIQPAGHANSPYLDKGMGGIGFGFDAGIDLIAGSTWTFGIEMSTAARTVEQMGRFVGIVIGDSLPRPLTADTTHRDTLVSFLPGIRGGTRHSSIFLRAGPSLVFGSTSRAGIDDAPKLSPAGRFAWTFGADYSIRLSENVSLSPFGRYSYAFRTEDAPSIGLGPHIFRLGVDVRFLR